MTCIHSILDQRAGLVPLFLKRRRDLVHRVHQVHGVVGLLTALGMQLWLQRMEAEHRGAGRGERYTGPRGVT